MAIHSLAHGGFGDLSKVGGQFASPPGPRPPALLIAIIALLVWWTASLWK